jgi:thermostable 8-oxoguanine DNA glycosylase
VSFLIDPSAPISYTRNAVELETFWFFCLAVAGKTAKTQARLLDNFIQSLDAADHEDDTPFTRVEQAAARGVLMDKVKASRLGQFNRLERAFRESTGLNLRACTVSDLEAIHGVGPKTARMFLMFTRPEQRFAALDTHVLKFLASKGLEVPKTTPPAGERYRKLEEEFLKLADKSGKSVADFDLEIWKSYAKA